MRKETLRPDEQDHHHDAQDASSSPAIPNHVRTVELPHAHHHDATPVDRPSGRPATGSRPAGGAAATRPVRAAEGTTPLLGPFQPARNPLVTFLVFSLQPPPATPAQEQHPTITPSTIEQHVVGPRRGPVAGVGGPRPEPTAARGRTTASRERGRETTAIPTNRRGAGRVAEAGLPRPGRGAGSVTATVGKPGAPGGRVQAAECRTHGGHKAVNASSQPA